ncbi:MAG: LamG-like jellyroll fold domain-containing protein [Phycisphaeraceae bacterium]
MKHSTKSRSITAIALAVGFLFASSDAGATTVGVWSMEGTPGGAVGAVQNSANPGFLDGAGEGGAIYSSSVIGGQIWDPVSGSVAANTSSLNMGNIGTARVRVLDDNALDASSFTVEAFILIGGDQAGFPAYVSHRTATPARGWQLDINASEQGRSRFDTAATSNQVTANGVDQSLAGGVWHHTAVSYNAATNTISHYVDYGIVVTRTLTGTAADATAVAADLLIGGAYPAGSAVDEVRYSNSVLTSSQFLRSVNNGFWQFEGTPGAAVGVVPNQSSPGHLDGNGQGGAVFGADRPNTHTLDPITGTIHNNTSSLNLGVPGLVRVLDDMELDAPAFTIEAFVKVQDQASFPAFINHFVGNTAGWQLDIDPQEEARVRIDTGTNNNQVIGSNPAQSLADGEWHHVAFTFDGVLGRFYVDYGNLATLNPAGLNLNVTNVAADLLFGSSTFPAGSFLDEVRFSAAPLDPSQFLRAVNVPEPATGLLLMAGLPWLMRRRRAIA